MSETQGEREEKEEAEMERSMVQSSEDPGTLGARSLNGNPSSTLTHHTTSGSTVCLWVVTD